MLKNVKCAILYAIITIIICIGLLFVASMIPKNSIQNQMQTSAKELEELNLFDHVTDYVFITRQDNYADTLLINIIYNLDADNRLRSLVSAPYYLPDDVGVKDAFAETVANDMKPFDGDELAPGFVDYSRYWHGSQVILRPLFVLFSVSQVRLLLGIVLLALTIWFIALLIKHGDRTFAICYAVALILLNIWMCAFCIEYITTFLIMAVQLPVLYSLLIKKRDRLQTLYIVLAVGAIMTAFVDFLTTETITLTMPVLIYLLVQEKDGNLPFKEELKNLTLGAVIWGICYAGMMALKWLIAMAVLGKEAFLEALSQAALRIGGDATIGNLPGADAVSNKEQITGALWRNLSCLFPFKDSTNAGQTVMFTIITLFVLFAIWYLFHKKLDESSSAFTLLVLVVGIIPFIRFLVLNNHAYIHFFFTYRAMIVTLTGLIYLAVKDISFSRKK